MKPFIKPLIFVGILFGLGGIAYWDDWQTKKDNKETESKNKLLAINPESTVRLDYTKEDEGKNLSVQLAKEGSRWKILAPIIFPGDSDAITRLLKTFEDLRFEKSFGSTPEKAKEFGLDRPKITLVLTDKEGKVTRIRIGGKNPVGLSHYAKIDETDQVYLVNQHVFTASSRELFDFRDRSLRWPNLDEVKAIGYQYENQPILALKRVEKDWLIENPKKFKGDAAAVKQFLDFFQNQKLAQFIDEPSAQLKEALSGKRAGTRRLATLVLTNPDDSLTQYVFFENGEDVYTTMENYAGFVVLDRKIKDGLKKSLHDFQDRSMFTYNSTEATELDLDGKLFIKKTDTWEHKSGGEKADFIQTMLVDLEFAKADQVLTQEEATPVMQGPPLHTAKISFKGGKTVDISVWKFASDAEHIAVKVAPTGYFKASKQLLENFESKPKLSEKLQPGDQG